MAATQRQIVKGTEANPGTASSATFAVALGAVLAGSSLAVAFTYSAGAQQTVSIADSLGQTWTVVQHRYDSTANATGLVLAKFDGTVVGTPTITVTYGSSVTYRSGVAREISGTSGLVTSAINLQAGSVPATDGVTSTAQTIATSGLMIAVAMNDGDARIANAGTGFTDDGTHFIWEFTPGFARFEHKSVTAGSVAGTFTESGTAGLNSYLTGMMVFGDSGVAAPTPLAPISASVAPAAVAAPVPLLRAGFGQPSQVATVVAPIFVRGPQEPVAPSRLAGVFVAAAAGVAAQISARTVPDQTLPVPALYAGSANDPGTITIGGVAGAFLPDEAAPPTGPRLFAGVPFFSAPVASVIAASGPASPVALAPSPALRAGFGQAAQVAVITHASDALPPVASSNPTLFVGVIPAGTAAGTIVRSTLVQLQELPPRGSIAAGFGFPSQVASIVFSPSAPPPVASPTPATFAGFGQAAQPPVISGPATAPFAGLPPLGAISAGFGLPSQVAVITVAASAPPALAVVQPAWTAGVIPPATTAGAVFRPLVVPVGELPPRGSIAAGFGFPAQNAAIVSAPTLPPRADLPPQGSTFAGFGQAAQPPVILRSAEVLRQVDAGATSLVAGFGQAAQVAVVVTAPRLPAHAESFLLPALVTGAGQVTLPVPPIYSAPRSASWAELPPQPVARAGFGQAPQVAQVITAPSAAPAVERFLLPSLAAGSGQAPTLPVPPVYSAPQSAAWVNLPPSPSLRAGFGQAAQVAQIIGQPSAAPSVDLLVAGRLFVGFGQVVTPVPFVGVAPQLPPVAPLPPAPARLDGFGFPAQVATVLAPLPAPLAAFAFGSLSPGVVPPIARPATILQSAPPPAAGLPPLPGLFLGFGQAAQVPVITSPVIVPANASVPPAGAMFAGVPIQPTAFIVSVHPPAAARLPPSIATLKGFGFPPGIAAVITVPFVTTGITLLPPGTSIFAGFGQPAPLFREATRSRSLTIDATGIGRILPRKPS